MSLREKKNFIGPPSGFPASVLSRVWEEAFQEKRDTKSLWPFKSKKQLPTKGQVLSLYFYFQSQDLKQVPKSKIMDLVVTEIKECWRKANIPTITDWNMKRSLDKLLSTRESLVKNLKKTGEKI